MNKAKPTKKKPETVSQLKKKAWVLFSQYIKLRDCLRTTGTTAFALCITCGKRYHYKVLQAGHFIPGRHNNNLFNPRGCHAQCYNCNINLKGNTLVYRRAIIDLYGPGADVELEDQDKVVRQWRPNELKELIEELKADIKKLEGHCT